jgi:hypothetical protein
MAAPIPLRLDYDGPGLRALARQSRDAEQTRPAPGRKMMEFLGQ